MVFMEESSDWGGSWGMVKKGPGRPVDALIAERLCWPWRFGKSATALPGASTMA